MTRAEFITATRLPYHQFGVAKIRAYAERMSRLMGKKLTNREAIRLEILKERTMADLADLDLEYGPMFWKLPDEYNSGGADFQHSVWRLLRLADEMEKHIVAPPEMKPYIRPAKKGWIYFLQSGDFVKIGYAANISTRMRTLDTGSPVDLILLHQERGNMDDEASFHKRFAELRVRGEWFRHEGPLAAYISGSKP